MIHDAIWDGGGVWCEQEGKQWQKKKGWCCTRGEGSKMSLSSAQYATDDRVDDAC